MSSITDTQRQFVKGAAGDNSIIRIGTQGPQVSTYIAAIYGATLSSAAPVYMNSSGQLGTSTSSGN